MKFISDFDEESEENKPEENQQGLEEREKELFQKIAKCFFIDESLKQELQLNAERCDNLQNQLKALRNSKK